MKKVYICSPYRAKDGTELARNIEYARELTRLAVEEGLAPITPHLYMTQCLNEDRPEEREKGRKAGMELLKCCDFLLAGCRYGISEGMGEEIAAAKLNNIKIVNEGELRLFMDREKERAEAEAWDYAKICACHFCPAGGMLSCTGYDCRAPYQKAYEYAIGHLGQL